MQVVKQHSLYAKHPASNNYPECSLLPKSRPVSELFAVTLRAIISKEHATIISVIIIN